ncbi:MAG: L-histidine N(alpha)-methyltransferase [Dokdonella sp.]
MNASAVLQEKNESSEFVATNPEFDRALRDGLRATPKSISPKYFYDERGSRLFDRICELPEYYPTRTEFSILEDNAADIAAQIGPRAEIIEFGAGSLTKVRVLLDALDQPLRFLPIDISGDHLESAAEDLRVDFPHIDVEPIAGDYTRKLDLPDRVANVGKRVGFFPGSTLGNFKPDEALGFLTRAASLLHGGGLLLGVDLVKSPKRLHAAYNDAEGVTAQFNLNLLWRANRELGADFNLDAFEHYAFYNAPLQRIEMHLVSRRAQTVTIGDEQFLFGDGETLHTESSYKFTIEGLSRLATQAGFGEGICWTDSKRLFSVNWLPVA